MYCEGTGTTKVSYEQRRFKEVLSVMSAYNADVRKPRAKFYSTLILYLALYYSY